MTALRSCLLAAALASGAMACTSEPGSSIVVVDDTPNDRVACLPIDEGEMLDVELGTGAGTFIEYHGAGLWHLFVTCDTDLSGFACGWDAVALVDLEYTLEVTDDTELDDDDALLQFDEGGVRLVMRTASDTDGIFFQTDETASAIFDTLIDGVSDPLVYTWVGDGVLRAGGPTNPLELVPPSSTRACP